MKVRRGKRAGKNGGDGVPLCGMCGARMPLDERGRCPLGHRVLSPAVRALPAANIASGEPLAAADVTAATDLGDGATGGYASFGPEDLALETLNFDWDDAALAAEPTEEIPPPAALAGDAPAGDHQHPYDQEPTPAEAQDWSSPRAYSGSAAGGLADLLAWDAPQATASPRS